MLAENVLRSGWLLISYAVWCDEKWLATLISFSLWLISYAVWWFLYSNTKPHKMQQPLTPKSTKKACLRGKNVSNFNRILPAFISLCVCLKSVKKGWKLGPPWGRSVLSSVSVLGRSGPGSVSELNKIFGPVPFFRSGPGPRTGQMDHCYFVSQTCR